MGGRGSLYIECGTIENLFRVSEEGSLKRGRSTVEVISGSGERALLYTVPLHFSDVGEKRLFGSGIWAEERVTRTFLRNAEG